MRYLNITINKPIYANYCGIREKYIWQAKRQKKMLRITTPNGVGTISPTKFMKGAERIEKVFLIPDKPMVLYANHVPIDKEEPEIIEDYTIPNAVRERMRERAIELGLYSKS